MRLLSVIIVATLLASAVPAAQPQGSRVPTGTASITGRVIDRESRQPVDQVLVSLIGAMGRQSLSTLTDADGVFRFEGIGPGDYGVVTWAAGFAPARYGQSDIGANSDEIVRVDEGDARKLFDLALVRAGAITGRITDASGAPLKDAIVDAWLIAEPGRYRVQGVKQVQRSNARGEYTVENLTAGNYYVAVQWIDPNLLSANAPPRRGVVFYPNVSTIADATAVRLAAGETARNVDVVIHRPQRHQLTGHFVRGAAGCAIEANLLSKGNSIRTIKVGADGAFDINQVEPGVYTIWARCHADGMTEVAVMTLQIDSDMSDLTLPLLAAGRLTGRVVTADGGPLPEGPLYVTAQLAAGGQEIDPLPRDRVEIAMDGSFDLPGVLGERKLGVTGLHPMWVVDHIRVGRSPATSVTVQPGAEVHDITVVLHRR